MQRRLTVLIGVVVGVGVAVVAGWAVREFMGGSQIDQAMAGFRKQPLMNQVLADHPDVEARVRSALEEDLRDRLAGQPRAFQAVVEIRKTIIGPTFAAADDTSALAVLKARADLARHLQKTDPEACRQFSGDGIRNLSKLDPEGQQLFRDMLTAGEAAYRSGKENGGKGKPMDAPAFVSLLQGVGFTNDDLAKFGQTTASDADVCALEVRVEEAPDKLPEDKRGAYARFVIAH